VKQLTENPQRQPCHSIRQADTPQQCRILNPVISPKRTIDPPSRGFLFGTMPNYGHGGPAHRLVGTFAEIGREDSPPAGLGRTLREALPHINPLATERLDLFGQGLGLVELGNIIAPADALAVDEDVRDRPPPGYVG